MGHPAHKLVQEEAFLEPGRVLHADENGLLVDAGRGPERALPAASCLLAPEAGDEVLLTGLPDGRVFVLSVLERAGASRAVLHFPDGLRLESGGDASIAAAGELVLSGVEAGIEAGRIAVRAAEVACDAGLLSLLAKSVRAAGAKVETAFERLVSRLGSSVRLIKEHDETQAGSIRSLATESHVVQAETIVQTAEKSVKIDADQVHLA